MWGSMVWSRLKYAADLSVSCQRRVVTNSDVVWHRSCATLISMLRHVCRNKRRLRSTRIAFRSWCTTRSSRSGSRRPRPPKRKNSNDTRYVLERHTVRTHTTHGTYSNDIRYVLVRRPVRTRTTHVYSYAAYTQIWVIVVKTRKKLNLEIKTNIMFLLWFKHSAMNIYLIANNVFIAGVRGAPERPVPVRFYVRRGRGGTKAERYAYRRRHARYISFLTIRNSTRI